MDSGCNACSVRADGKLPSARPHQADGRLYRPGYVGLLVRSTIFTDYFFTSGQVDFDKGMNAWSPGKVATSL